MSIGITNLILSCLVLGILPLLVGGGVLHLCRQKVTITASYVYGMIAIWAVCEIITVPLVMLKISFTAVVIAMAIFVVFCIIYAINTRCIPKMAAYPGNVWEWIAAILLAGLLMFVLYKNYVMQYTDADDSRFVVNAVDILRTNRMFLTNPATGEALTVWEGELIKDVTSPWAVFLALGALCTGVMPTIFAHTILPIYLLMLLFCLLWQLSDAVSTKEFVNRCIFVGLCVWILIYGNYSDKNAETFTMIRLWQGKAVVSTIGVLFLMLLFLRMYHAYKQKETVKCWVVLLVLGELALCLCSGMGIILGAILAGCFGLVYAIRFRKITICLQMWLPVFINVCLYGINVFME
ncbi:MAG: DUF6077 domain-containing protein [Wujia sp.]